MSNRKYWFVKPEYYIHINTTLNTFFSNEQIELFYQHYKNGIYVSYDNINNWGFMPYPDYSDYRDHSIMKDSKDWYNERGYVYKGDITRLVKLKKLNEL